jgi:uncharacterized membrane protein HdeD (DUF308 family)
MATAHTASDHAAHLPLAQSLARNWWLLLLRGVAAIAFGVIAMFWPGKTIFILLLMWAAYVVVDGAFSLWAGITGGGNRAGSRWWLIFFGAVSILAGIAALFWPGMTAIVLLIYIGIWAIIMGVGQIAGAISLRKEIEGEWMLGLSGVVSILFGAFVLLQPGAGALALVWTVGIWAIVIGILSIGLALRVRSWKRA